MQVGEADLLQQRQRSLLVLGVVVEVVVEGVVWEGEARPLPT